MNTLRFEYLIDLEKTGNISRTAANFFVSPSAVSQCLTKEEKELGHKIFTYQGHQMQPTEVGKAYLETARRILSIKQSTYDKLQIHRQSLRKCRISITSLLYESYTELLKTQTSDDNIEIFCAGSRVGTEYILSGFADLAVTCSGTLHKQPSVCSVPIFEDHLVLLVPKAYLRTFIQAPPTIRDCETIPFILLKSTSLMRHIEDEILIKSHITVPRIYEADDFLSARNLLLEGRGACFLPAEFMPPKAKDHFFVIEPDTLWKVYFSVRHLDTASDTAKKIAMKIAEFGIPVV